MEQQPDSELGYSIVDLVAERLQIAQARLNTAYREFAEGDYDSAANRAFFSIHRSIIAIHAMDRNHFRRHKDAIAKFNEKYVAIGVFPREFGRAIHKAAKLRDESDYIDFAHITKEQVKETILFADKFLHEIRDYCEKHLHTQIALYCPDEDAERKADKEHDDR